MTTTSDRYRLKALGSEQFSRDATDAATSAAWSEIAIEWHVCHSACNIDPLSRGIGVQN